MITSTINEVLLKNELKESESLLKSKGFLDSLVSASKIENIK